MSLFFTEVRRSLRVTLALVLCALLSGLTGYSALTAKRYIETIFKPVTWNADLMILPKGVTPEGLQRSLLSGEPEGLLPLALFETLQAQVNQEMLQKHLPAPALRVLGFVPFRSAGHTQVAFVGDREAYFAEQTYSIWRDYSWNKWTDVQSDLAARPGYQTPEWKDKVLMGVLARGEPGPIASLKNLIDRRTVAQGVLVRPGDSDMDHRLAQLDQGLWAVVGLIFVCLLPGLVLALIVLGERRKRVLIVMHELGFTSAQRLQLLLFQVLFLILAPAGLGVLAAWWTSPALLDLLHFT